MKSQLSAALFSITASLALPLLSGTPASAITVTIGSTNYDVDVFFDSYNNQSIKFQAPTMPWWGLGDSGSLAAAFATQVYDQLGAGPESGYGPVFAYEPIMTDIAGVVQKIDDPMAQKDVAFTTGASVRYAFVRFPVSSPPSSVPGPLPVLGVAAAMGWSRRIRRRITASTFK